MEEINSAFCVFNQMLLFLHIQSLHKPLLSLPPLLSLCNNRRSFLSTVALDGRDEPKNNARIRQSSSSSSRSIHALQEDSQQFEVDKDKAREALKNLDQQLQSLSQKQPTPPNKKVEFAASKPDMRLESAKMREDMPEISGSFLGYTAFALLIFTIFYNVLFYAVIQPAIDGPSEPVPATTITEGPKAAVSLQLSPMPEVSMQP